MDGLPALANGLSTALGYLGVTVLTGAAAAYGLFRWLGDKWLSNKFNERLESYKHDQQRELEHLRARINTLLDRTVKLHQQEFDVLPEVWERLNEAYGHMMDLTSRLQSYPDLDRMGDAQLEDFLGSSDLREHQKAELRTGNSKVQRYAEMRFWQVFYIVDEKYRAFNRYFVTKSIFIQPEIKAAIAELRDMMHEALVEREVEQRDPDPRPDRYEKGDQLRREGRSKLDAIGELVRARLWSMPSLDGRGANAG